MNHLFKILIFLLLFSSCKSKIDLSKLKLDEEIEDVVNFNERNYIGFDTVEAPLALLIESEDTNSFNYDNISLENEDIIFQIHSEKVKKETRKLLKYGGGHIEIVPLKDKKQLIKELKQFEADKTIYGFRIKLRNEELKKKILEKLIEQYGEGLKNPHTDNGFYWNIKEENKYIFYAPDYDRLIVLNNTKLSKTCYYDQMNGILDFGGCDIEKYFKDHFSSE